MRLAVPSVCPRHKEALRCMHAPAALLVVAAQALLLLASSPAFAQAPSPVEHLWQRGYYGTLNDAAAQNVLVVPVNQPLGRLVFMLLEPRSDDGIVAWAVLPPETYTAHLEYPIRRIHGTLPPR